MLPTDPGASLIAKGDEYYVSNGNYISYMCREYGFMWALLTRVLSLLAEEAREAKVHYDCSIHSLVGQSRRGLTLEK